MNAIQNILDMGQKNGGKIALIADNRKITYSNLEKSIWGYSNILINHGIKINDRIAIFLEDSPSHITLHLATMMIGAVPISLNTRLTEIEVLNILKDSIPSLFVSNSKLLNKNKIKKLEISSKTSYLDSSVLENIPNNYKFKPNRIVSYKPNTPAFMLYSSGTTGNPKGVVHGYSTLDQVDSIYDKTFKVNAGDIVFCSSKLFFAYALGNGYLGPLKRGLTIILNPKWPTISGIIKVLSSYKVKIFFSVPSIYRHLYKQKKTHTHLKKIKYCISAGERLPNNLHTSWYKTIGNIILDCYGTSETVVLIVVSSPSNKDDLTIKKPVKEAKYKLQTKKCLNNKNSKYGILWIKHPANALGYWNRPSEQNSIFKKGWINTGDIWKIDKKGSWHHQGRSDNLIKIAGQWVNPLELEELIISIPEISEVATSLFKTETGYKRLALFVVSHKKAYEKLISEKITLIVNKLPKYKRPKVIKIVDELPYTATGKIKRSSLLELLKG